MLDFTEDYLKMEKRDGFVVNELMKRTWAAQLEVLDRIIAICEKYDLTYYAYGGTLLGAVRHHGFIPWDDDLDIAMKRDDYIKFLEVAKRELPEEYCILNAYTENEYENIFTRITNGHAIDFSDKKLEQYHNCPFVVGIDIFPLYYVSRDTNQTEAQKNILNLINALNVLIENINAENQAEFNIQIAEGLVELQKITGYQFTTEKPIRTQLEIVYDKVGRLFQEEESDALTLFPCYMADGYIIEKELLAEYIQMPFENMMLNVPIGYDVILKKSYRDYMVPRKVQGAHDYPFYKEQLQVLGRYIEKQDCNWKILQKKNADELTDFVAEEKTGILLPKAWFDRIKGKKVILYHTSADALMCYGEFVPDKLRYILEEFKNNQNVVLWWFPCLLDNPDMQFIKKMSPQLVREYHQIMGEFRRENWGIYDDTGDMQRAVAMADAYYGDESELLQLFLEKGKYAMIQDYEIVN